MPSLVWVMLALTVWGVASAIWSITPGTTTKTAIGFGLTVVAAIAIVTAMRALTADERNIVEKAIVAGGAVGLAWMAVDLFLGGVVFARIMALKGREVEDAAEAAAHHLSPSASVAACFVWVWSLAIYRRHGLVFSLMGLGFGALVTSAAGSETPFFAMLVGMSAGAGIALFAACGSIRWARNVGSAVLVAYVLGFPWFVLSLPHIYEIIDVTQALPSRFNLAAASLYHRITIWQTAVAHMTEAPVLGLGLDTARALYDKTEMVSYRYMTEAGEILMSSNFEPIPLHPHNFVIQYWLEVGAVGAAMVALILVTLFRGVLAGAPGFGVVMKGGAFMTAFAISSISFGALQSWWLCTLVLTAAFFAALPAHTREAGPT